MREGRKEGDRFFEKVVAQPSSNGFRNPNISPQEQTKFIQRRTPQPY
jgi:hypothetical protein